MGRPSESVSCKQRLKELWRASLEKRIRTGDTTAVLR